MYVCMHACMGVDFQFITMYVIYASYIVGSEPYNYKSNQKQCM